MAEYGSQIQLPAFKSGADFTGKRYRAVDLNDSGYVVLASVPTSSNIVGIIQNEPQSLEHATVCVYGLTKVVAGSAFSIGDLLTVTASSVGKAVKATYPVSGATLWVIGRALEAATAKDDKVSMLVSPFYIDALAS